MSLADFLKTRGQLTAADLALAVPYFVREEIPKGAYYLREGHAANKVSFVEKGLFRLFYQLNGEEKIMLFFSEGQFMTDYFGFLTRTPSLRPIQALEDAVVYSIDYAKLHQLFEQSKNWERIGRQMAESAYVASVLRANRLLHDDYDTRFSTFMSENPGLLQRVPQYMIASYLHMTPETLSRVKKRAMKKSQPPPSIHQQKGTDFLI